MATDTTVHRDIGRHDAEIEALDQKVERLTDAVEALTKEVAKIQATLNEARGGWRMLMILGGAGAAFGISLRELLEAILRHAR